MKFSILLFVLSFLSFNLFAQVESIELPEVDMKMGMIMEPHYDFYVTKSNHIIYKKDTINIKNIKEVLYEPSSRYGISLIYAKKQIHLLADINVKYRLIDEIRTEIASTNSSKYIVYRSNFNSRKSRDIRGLKHKSPMSYYSFSPPKYLQNREKINDIDSIVVKQSELMPDTPLMPNEIDSYRASNVSIERAVYSLQKDIIDEVVNSKKIECFILKNEGLVNSDNKIIRRDDFEKSLLKNDVIFLKYDTELLYGNYIKIIAMLQEITPNFVSNSNKAKVIELSNQIQNLHKKLNIVICN